MKDILSNLAFIPVVTLEEALKVLPLCEALLEGGTNILEIVFRSKAAAEAMKLAKKEFPDMIIGAGTVVKNDQVKEALDLGVSFLVSPGLNTRLIRRAKRYQCLMIPGATTPTEIQQAMNLGLELVKFFPAEQAGGIQYLKAVSSVFPVQFMPTGGITGRNIFQYLELSNVLCCGGSLLTPLELIKEEKWKEISKRVRLFNNKIQEKEK